MANPQHVEWLKEGVEAWNARRRSHPFSIDLSHARLVPKGDLEALDCKRIDFEGADLRGAQIFGVSFEYANLKRASLVETVIDQCVLDHAKCDQAFLEASTLDHCSLKHASFFRAVFQRVEVINCDFTSCDLRGVDFGKAKLASANFQSADFRTNVNYVSQTSQHSHSEFTNLSKAEGLTQEQIEVALGDQGTRLPKGLDKPSHWPDLLSDLGSGAALFRHITRLMENRPHSAASALDLAQRIEFTVTLYHNALTKNQTEEGEALFAIAQSFRSFSHSLQTAGDQASDAEALVAVLQARIAEQNKQISILSQTLKSQPNSRSQIMVAALGAAGGTAITTAASFLLGPEGTLIADGLWNALTGWGASSSPPVQLPDKDTLPWIGAT
ncbi:pentapeptide repeat-containing protein [Tropicibacter sp. R15_0]|uniref:pentapeptide repeat-containing protein n=1 Tax=Tropicibacter sp. R15_0 TaxID=2821101 RepID=UPI001ADC4C24|nr:pentapeptide repeat-containing protein [Tropicibacter sp. R15_0]MBO9464933.1 pentapeptide repeat-containing protein [Tropicibacter sp. R15_0]